MSYRNRVFLQIYYYSPFLVKNLISSLYGWLQKKERYGRFYHSYFQFLLNSQWYPNERLEEIQFEKIKRFLIHASKHSVFYKNLFNEYDFRPELMQSASDLSILPILSK